MYRRTDPIESGIAAAFLGFFVLIIVALVIGAPGRFMSDDNAIRTLENHGFTNIKVVEKDPYFAALKGCSEEDVVLFRAYALNARDNPVTVHVCQGWPFKGATIRE